ncbi:hypothetical protein [Leptolyngbya sp. FACHB-261]|uniref:hypothetical protein n=1 Tax=Leptolyngbya sp. FACHB-261 TaxID=2692806 RepID=UPI001685013F|nr:hypothetical protein [Leptolyngbya sp. FACHB-261]
MKPTNFWFGLAGARSVGPTFDVDALTFSLTAPIFNVGRAAFKLAGLKLDLVGLARTKETKRSFKKSAQEEW